MNVRHTEAETAALIARFADESNAAPAAPVKRAPAEPVTAPETGYRVVVGGSFNADVEATGYGAAVLAAIAVLSRVVPNVRGYVFMWDVSVTDSYGVTVDGKELADMIQAARIAAQRSRIS